MLILLEVISLITETFHKKTGIVFVTFKKTL